MTVHDWLLRRYERYRALVPPRLLYHRDYSRVLAIGADDAGLAQRRLRLILQGAVAHVPFYRRTVKLSPAALAHEAPLALLARFPLLDKAQVMDCQRDFVDERVDTRRLHYATSGGSSGQGIGLWRSKRLADIEKAFFMRAWSRYGFNFDKARVLRIGADARQRADAPPCQVVGNRLLLSPYHLSPRHLPAIVDAVQAFRPDFVHGYPSSAAALAELLGRPWPLRAALLASEPALPAQLKLIAEVFCCPVSVNYGLTERTNLAFADMTGPYRFDPLYAINENTDEQEIIGTSLWNDVMPLIRYRTGDFGAIAADGSCAAIDGRGQEFLIGRQGERIPGLSIVIDEATWDFVRLYQVRQRQPGAIALAVVARRGRLSEAQRRFVLDAQLRRWGGLFDIALEEVDDIALSANGKRRLVVSA